ncbi:cyclic nucleotide-binding domain protein (macronuclear) [Tetrahymena thermophila SB210]|uniref:Cyclic nucleotide-binding domain protein n=1 Tax=Tetrahymena thermophila (strain SB210) TaxID=312017 RepID=Q22T23_TETTS|nr:cyclic nucleotide-binding domain protein [Tetrahymena thermophila SB210]EAR88615.1 cyclic nucleotide-binding domain protein [Tetrahymena thermophila SB210]|eukprot:XP_001008860.1 cyclic nucleotide-binding domain protein [Tetrahymena thermophila SB210]
MNQTDDIQELGLIKRISLVKSGSNLSPGKSPTKRGQVKITYGSIKNYIMEDPKNRQFYDIQKMQQYFRTLPYFDKICSKLDITRQTTVLEKFCKKLRYMTQDKGEFLFKQNEKSEYFYILLEGKVSLLIPKRDDVIEQEKQNLPVKVAKNLQKQVALFYESSPSSRIKTFLGRNFHHQDSINRQSITNLIREDSPRIIISDLTPQSSQTPIDSKKKQSFFNLQSISPIRQPSVNPSPFKLKHQAEQSIAQLEIQHCIQSNKNSNSRSSLKVVTKSNRGSTKSMQTLEIINSIIPKIVKQQFSKEYQQIIEDQAKQFDLSVEGEGEYYGSIYEYLFDGHVFKYTFGKILQSGEAIGGVDILNNKSRREAVLCIDDCELCCISKTEYIEILKEIEESKFNKKLNRLIESLDPEIPHLRRLMGRMVPYLKKQKFKRGQVIYNQNEEINGCYLITQGEIEIVKELKMVPPENHIEKYAYRQIQPNVQRHSLACVSVGQYIGEEELLLSQDYRNSSAICNSYECKVYFIEKQHFLKLITDQLDIRIAFEKAIKQKEKFNSQKFKNLQKIIQSNYNEKFQIRDTSSREHLLKYKDDKNQFRDCYQKIIYLEMENQKKKEIPSNQESIGGVAKQKRTNKNQQSNDQCKRIILQKKSASAHNQRDKQLNTLNITLKIKEHQNNTAEALTNYYIKSQSQIEQQKENKIVSQKSISLHLRTQPDESHDSHDEETFPKSNNEKKPKLDILEYFLKGNKHAKCQVSKHLKNLQKKESNKEKMSKTLGSTFFLGVYQKIAEDFNQKKQQEEQNQIFHQQNQEQNTYKTKNIHVLQQQSQNQQVQQSSQKSQILNNSQQENQQDKVTFCGPTTRPYTPELDTWKQNNFKRLSQNKTLQNSKTDPQNQEIKQLHNQTKLNSFALNLSYNRNHELHLIKSHKCFQKSHISVQQIIKKTNQIVTLGDYQKQHTSSKKQLEVQKQENQIDQEEALNDAKNYNFFEEKQMQTQDKIVEMQKKQMQQSNTIETYVKQFGEQSTNYHFNQSFKPNQRAISAKNLKYVNGKRTRNISTDRDTNNQSTTNISNQKLNRTDLSFDSKSVSVIIVNHMGQPRKYVY